MSTELDIAKLEEEFDLNSLTNDSVPAKTSTSPKEILEMRDKLKAAEEMGEASDILRMNIARANNFLDIVEYEIEHGATLDARKMEASAKMISEITNAANSLTSADLQTQGLDIRERTLTLKEFEVKNKIERQNENAGQPGEGGTVINNNVVVAPRDEIVKMLKEEANEKLALEQDNEIIDV